VFALLVAGAYSAFAPLNKADRPFEGRYIVVFHSNTTVADAASTVKYFTSLGIKMKNTYNLVIKGFCANLTKAQLMKVRVHPLVNYIDQDGEARIAETVEVNQGGKCVSQHNAPSWGLARVCNQDPPDDDDFKHLTLYGRGVNVYIIDTGIYIAHSDFGGRAKWGYTASDINPPGEYDGNGHGTHCASTAAGTYYGVSKGATLIAVKCLGDGGGGSWSGVIESIEWVANEHRKNPNIKSVGSMSLGGGKQQSCNDATIGATMVGVVMAAAAGNSNTDTCSFSPASASYNNGQITAVIAVGATQQGPVRDERATYSNYGGQCTSIMAPGTSITGAWIGAPDAERTISGTSMACPHVAGVAAAILGDSRYSGFNPGQVKDKLINDASYDKIDLNCPGTGTCLTTPNAMLHTNDLCTP
jgi:subtilisin family serine protease